MAELIKTLARVLLDELQDLNNTRKYNRISKLNSKKQTVTMDLLFRSDFKINSKIDFTLQNNVKDQYYPSDNYIKTLKINTPKILTENKKLNDIILQEGENNKKYETTVIGKNLTTSYSYNKIPIKGNGLKRGFIFSNGVRNYYSSFDDVKLTKESIEIDISIKDAIIIAKKLYNKKRANIKAELCYYSSKNSNLIVPAYKISGTEREDNDIINLLETFLPASSKHISKSVKLDFNKNIEKPKNIQVRNKNQNDNDNNDNTYRQKEYLNFNIPLITFKKYDNSDVVEMFSLFDEGNILKDDNSINIRIPREISKEFSKKIKKYPIFVNTTNKFGFTISSIYYIDLSKFISIFKTFNRVTHGGNRHNYGVEWAECCIGESAFNNFIGEMNKWAYQEYALDHEISKEKDFRDKDNDGLDYIYVDNVDISGYIGHGNGNGFKFLTSDHDKKLKDTDAAGGKAWGDRDVEFMGLLSCQVLKENHGSPSRTWAERWGPSFNGLHLLCGFQTNAYQGDHGMLEGWAKNMYKNEQTVMISWFNSALLDQPDDTEAVVMGPLVQNSNKSVHNSVPSSISSLHRAHWNDYTWGVNYGPGKDIPREDIRGFWRVVMTV